MPLKRKREIKDPKDLIPDIADLDNDDLPDIDTDAAKATTADQVPMSRHNKGAARKRERQACNEKQRERRGSQFRVVHDPYLMRDDWNASTSVYVRRAGASRKWKTREE